MKGRIILIGRSTESRSRSSSNIINKIINSSSKDLRLSYTTITTCPEGKVDWWAKIRQKSQEYSSTISLQKLVNFYRNTNNNTFLLSATFLQKNVSPFHLFSLIIYHIFFISSTDYNIEFSYTSYQFE